MKTLAQVVAVAATCTSRPWAKLPVTSFLSCVLPLLACCTFLAAPAHANTPPELDAAKHKQLAALRLPFIANQGQFDADVRFYARTFGGTTFVTADGKLVHAFAESPPAKDKRELGKSLPPATPTPIRGWSLIEELVQARPIRSMAGEEPSASHVSSFVGNDRSKWQSDVPTYGSVSLGDVYPHIGYRLKAYGNNVEKLFEVHPGGNPADIQVRLQGAQGLKVTEDGALEITTELGPIRFTAPIAYQEQDGKRIPIEVAYALTDDGYKFKLGNYDKTNELVIDPLLQSTYLGGSGDDVINALTLDAGGNVYVTGTTSSSNFPGTTGGARTANAGGTNDAFVAKLNSSLTSLIQATYLGGSGGDIASALAIDASGNIFVAGGTTSNNFPGTAGGAQPAASNASAFIVKLNSGLTNLIQATYLGGSIGSGAAIIALDATGNVYVGGSTWSANFPGTAGGAQAAHPGGDTSGFVAKLNGTLTTLFQATYLGDFQSGSSVQGAIIVGLALAPDGNVYVTGVAEANSLPGTAGGAQTIHGGSYDAFVAKFNGGLTNLIQATYLGGSGIDRGESIAIDAAGHVYVAGHAEAGNFPGTSGGAKAANPVGLDAFIAKLNGGLTSIIQSTYLGGSNGDLVTGRTGLAIDAFGDIYVVGQTNSNDFPGTAGGAQATYGGGYSDAFVSKLNSSLTGIVQTTYLGGSDFDEAYSLALDGAGHIYVAGQTYSNDFQATVGGAQPTFGSGAVDSFVTKLSSLAATNAPGVSITSNAAINFNTQLVSVPSGILSVTLSNTGTAPLTISAISINGANAADFIRVTGGSNCATGILAIGSSCTLSMVFVPSALGARSATIAVTSNAPGSPSSVQLNGVGTIMPLVSLTPGGAVAPFIARSVGTASPSHAVTLKNTGNTTLNIGAIGINGTHASDFHQANNCGVSLNAGASCSINVTFTPTALGPRNANLTITSDAPGSPHYLSLNGTVTLLNLYPILMLLLE